MLKLDEFTVHTMGQLFKAVLKGGEDESEGSTEWIETNDRRFVTER